MHGPSQYQIEIHRTYRNGRAAGAYLSQHRIAPDGRVFCLGFSARCSLAVARATAREMALPVIEIREDVA